MSNLYTPQNWFWIVGGDESRYYSSAARGYVSALPEDAGVTRIASEAELWDVLRGQSLLESFLARDLIALLRPADITAIQTAIASTPALALLWAALLAQGEAPIEYGNERFQQGWAGLTQAIGQTRADEILQALRG